MSNSLLTATPCIALMLILNFGNVAESCFCAPDHPQAKFCRSDFAIKALVGRSRIVELRPNGKYRKVDKEEMVPEVEFTDFSEPSETTNATEGLLEDEKPAPYGGPIGPNGKSPDDHSDNEGLQHEEDNVLNLDPPGSGSGHNSSRKRRSPHIPYSGYQRYFVGGAPGMSYLPIGSSPTFMVQYRITILKVFKGLENFTKQQRRFLYTPPAPLCSRELSTERKPYILMGHVYNGVLKLTMCDYVLELDGLSEDERKNAVRNMQTRYPKACPLCHVRVCDRNGCNKELKEPYCCEWEEWWTAQSTEASQYSCLQTKKGECKWYNPLRTTRKT